MLKYPDINPVAFHLGPLAIHWYGLMYLIGFFLGWSALSWRLKKHPDIYPFTKAQLSDFIFYVAVGVILGGRLGYIFFYDWSYFIANPLFVFQTWKGGMSFHGGLIGVMVALWIYSKMHKIPFFCITDFLMPAVPLGLGMGRIGNFINSELWGRTTTVPWGMIFPNGGDIPRHPSQLYEFLLEGVVLFTVLWIFSSRNHFRGVVSGLFLILYGIFRFGVEFYREPDPQTGYILQWFTEGQLLSLPMIFFGIILLVWAYTGKRVCSNI